MLDRTLPPLSRAANYSRLWMAIATLLATFGGRFGKRAAVRGMVSIGLTSALVNLSVKPLVRRPRPSLRIVPSARRLPQPLTTSFPSGHAASAAAFAVGASLELPAAAPALMPLAYAVGHSRVYTGAHYPLDVAVGWAVGASVALATRIPWPTVSSHARPSLDAGLDAPAVAPNPDGAGVGLVANPGAGSANGSLDELRQRLPAANIIEADAKDLEDAMRRAAEQHEVVGVLGGDGSASAAAAAAVAQDKPMLLIPGGTLNHLAGDLGIETLEDAANALECGQAAAVDMATIDGRPFLNAAALGAYPAVLAERERLQPRIGRWPAHLAALLRSLLAGRPLEVVLDGRRRRLWTLFAGNSDHGAPGIVPGWRSRLDDGMIDVRLIDASRRFSRLRALVALLLGRLERSPVYERWLAPRVTVESDRPSLRLMRDGDTFEGSGSFEIAKPERKLLVFAPREEGAGDRS